MDYAYQEKHPPTKLAAMVTTSNACLIQDQPWLADSVATYHVTASLSHLNFPKPYNGQDHLTIGMAKISQLHTLVMFIYPLLNQIFISLMFLGFLPLHQTLPHFINSIMTIIVGAILMKMSFPFRLWP